MVFLLGTQEHVRNSRGKQVIGVRATEVLLYTIMLPFTVGDYFKRNEFAPAVTVLLFTVCVIEICLSFLK